MKGLYLAIATIAASFILHFVFANWDAVTHGVKGVSVPPRGSSASELGRPFSLYFLIVPIRLPGGLRGVEPVRTRIGRAFIAIPRSRHLRRGAGHPAASATS